MIYKYKTKELFDQQQQFYLSNVHFKHYFYEWKNYLFWLLDFKHCMGLYLFL